MLPGSSADRWNAANKLMRKGVEEKVFPGAILLVWYQGRVVYHKGVGLADVGEKIVPVTPSMVYDLASLTKPLATTLSVIYLVSRGKLSLDDNLQKVFEGQRDISDDKKLITVRHLLSHTSGYPAYRPYYQKLASVDPRDRGNVLFELLTDESLEAKPGEKTCYSDLGFLMLQVIIETITGESLWNFVCKKFFWPLKLNTLVFSPKQLNLTPPSGHSCVSTGLCPWRKRKLCGEVHDENASVLGGIAGHAGLFGSARDICSILVFLFRLYKGGANVLGIDSQCVQIFWRRQKELGDGSRTLGFDTPSVCDSSAGKYFSENSVGHLGFTGTSFWFDLEKELLVILLSNRVYFGRNNEKIKAFRPAIHDTVVECLNLM